MTKLLSQICEHYFVIS